MPTTALPFALIVAAAGVVLVLLVAAAGLWWLVRRREQAVRERAKALAELQRERRHERERGLRIIAQALLDGQVGVSEACLRLDFLMAALEWPPAARAHYQAIGAAAEAVRHIPTHEAWRALPAVERLDYEVQMVAVEERHEADVRVAAERLLAQLRST